MSLPTVKDSGVREAYDTGMVRDTQDGKPMFGLVMRQDIPYEQQMFVRWAALMTAGAKKYGVRNWELARTQAEVDRFKESAFRHFMQWYTGQDDEDHAAAVMFNINAHESTKWVMNNRPKNEREVKLDAREQREKLAEEHCDELLARMDAEEKPHTPGSHGSEFWSSECEEPICIQERLKLRNWPTLHDVNLANSIETHYRCGCPLEIKVHGSR